MFEHEVHLKEVIRIGNIQEVIDYLRKIKADEQHKKLDEFYEDLIEFAYNCGYETNGL